MNEELPSEVKSLQREAMNLCFKTLLAQKDLLSLIVTSHLYVEYWLEWLIRKSIPKPENILDKANLRFTEKLALAESLDLIGNKLAKAVRKLNNIRNRVAHTLEYKISKNDLELMASFTPNLTNEDKSLISKMGSPKSELMIFCTFFAGYCAGSIYGR